MLRVHTAAIAFTLVQFLAGEDFRHSTITAAEPAVLSGRLGSVFNHEQFPVAKSEAIHRTRFGLYQNYVKSKYVIYFLFKDGGRADSFSLMDNFTTLEQWQAEQERLGAQRDFCGLWQWLVIAGCILLRVLS